MFKLSSLIRSSSRKSVRRAPGTYKTWSWFEALEPRLALTVIAPVSNTTIFPYSAAVQIDSIWDSDGDRILESTDRFITGSGAIVDDYHVLTAAHCIYDTEINQYATWVFVHPGRNSDNYRPFGEIQATSLAVT